MIPDRSLRLASPGKRDKRPVVGLLGGSFNPAHAGHRRVSLFALRALGLAEVWWMVSPGNPLKPRRGMAPLPARMLSARAQSRNAPIHVTAIEQTLGTRYTIDSLRLITRKYQHRRFVWLMGADNLAQFHRWKDWRGIAREMPIAVIVRPGYDKDALASPAMAWLRRFRLPVARFRNRREWSVPALIKLRFDPDPRSASAIRRSNPRWADAFGGLSPRDEITRRIVQPDRTGLAGHTSQDGGQSADKSDALA